jgi:uncharacterized membrane protein YebE (DUF533 family)
MFNPEKILGGLLRSTTQSSRGGLGNLLSGGVALGALGVAMEAVEHFMNKPSSTATPPAQPGVSSAPSPSVMRGGSPPPPPPPRPDGARAVPPPPPAAPQPIEPSESVLLIRAMIAAANADGVIDQTERKNILERLQSVELSSEEHAFIAKELLAPVEMEAIVAGVTTPQLAEQVYSVSLMAIDVDTDQERRYLATLADRLALDPETVERIHNSLKKI